MIKKKEIIDVLKNREDDDGIQLYFEEKYNLNDLMLHEEIYWKQRAKFFWSEEGDTNSKKKSCYSYKQEEDEPYIFFKIR